MLQLMSYTLRSVPQNSTPEQLEEMVAVSFRASDSFRPRLKPCHRASCRVYERQESTITRLLHNQKVLFERIYCIFFLVTMIVFVASVPPLHMHLPSQSQIHISAFQNACYATVFVAMPFGFVIIYSFVCCSDSQVFDPSALLSIALCKEVWTLFISRTLCDGEDILLSSASSDILRHNTRFYCAARSANTSASAFRPSRVPIARSCRIAWPSERVGW